MADPHWPNGFDAELAEIIRQGDDLEPRFDRMVDRVVEEVTLLLLNDTMAALGPQRAKRAAFEARLEGRWGRAFDLFELTVDQAMDTGESVNAAWRPRAAADQDFNSTP